jgi:predicted TIM-barrel fold metal-dependent hydrolase
MIIDIHVHDWIGAEARDAFSDIRRMLALADGLGIGRLVLLGNVLRFGVRANQDQIRTINDTTIDLVKKYPDRLAGFCFVNPVLDAGFLREEIDRCIRDEGLCGIKLEIDLNARDKRLKTVMNKAAEHDVPVLHHSWYLTVGDQPYASDPSDIACLAGRYPHVRIVMAHLTGCGARGVLDVLDCPNVWVDTSGSQPLAGMVEYGVKMLGADRIVFGSDVPGRDFSCQLGRIYGAKIGRRDREKILWKNAERLLARSRQR